jgi:hypothetical protein
MSRGSGLFATFDLTRQDNRPGFSALRSRCSPLVDVVTEIIIERPRLDVARYATNPDNAPSWYVNIERVEWRSPPPLRVGSEIAFVARFMGRRLAYTYRVMAPGQRLVMATAEGPFPMETIYEWESVAANGTRMRLRNRGQPSGFSTLIAPFVAWAMRRANRKDLANLKQTLERGG